MGLRFLYISSSYEGSAVFPCDLQELKLTLLGHAARSYTLRRDWPRHGHGEEWRMGRDVGIAVLDLQSESPHVFMTPEELVAAGVVDAANISVG